MVVYPDLPFCRDSFTVYHGAGEEGKGGGGRQC